MERIGALWGGTEWLRSHDLARRFHPARSRYVAGACSQGSALMVRKPLVGLGQVPIQERARRIGFSGAWWNVFRWAFSRTTWWAQIVGNRAGWNATVYNTIGLLFSMALITALFLGCVRWMQRRDGNTDRDFEDGFALSLVPVALGYAIAHYAGMAIFEGQQLAVQLSDPLDRGWNLIGTADTYVNYRIVGPTVIASIQALGIVVAT